MYLLLLTLTALMIGSSSFRYRLAQIMTRPMGMSSLILLMSYFGIALVDSVHIKLAVNRASYTQVALKTHYTTQAFSLLDLMLAPLGQHYEKSYSAPFALYLLGANPTPFSQTTLADLKQHKTPNKPITLKQPPDQLNDPSTTQKAATPQQASAPLTAERLRYAGLGLGIDQKKQDIFIKAGTYLLKALGLSCLLLIGMIFTTSGALSFSAILAACRRIYTGKTRLAVRSAWLTLTGLLVIGYLSFGLSQHYHILGTDKVGQDVFYETLKSIRTGWIIGTLTLSIMLPLSIVLGILAGYQGGWVDDIIQYIYTTFSSVPSVLLIAAAALSLQILIAKHASAFLTLDQRADVQLFALCCVLGLTSWTPLCRLLRGETLKLRENAFVESALTLGSSRFCILYVHILPNLMHIILITAALDFSTLVLAEAVLSYIGIGVDPTLWSWGNMINAARMELGRDPVVWWPLLAAFVLMFTLVLASNFLSDVLRDILDPHEPSNR